MFLTKLANLGDPSKYLTVLIVVVASSLKCLYESIY